MKRVFNISVVLLFAVAIPLGAQVVPEGTSPRKLSISGNLTYSARYSQMADFYSNGPSGQLANLSGDFGYSTTSERHPTTITLGAGDSWTISGPNYNNGPYENLALSQGVAGEHSSLQLSDTVGYRKGASVTGFSGAPGTGEPIGQPSPTPPTDEPILTLNTTMVNNDASGEYRYKVNAFSSLSAGGSWNLLRFPNGNGIDTDDIAANLGWTQRLNARNSLLGEYAYSHYSYSDFGITFDVNTPAIGWQRTWTRTVSSSVSAGPQWITSSGSISMSIPGGPSANIEIPSSTGFSGAASISDNTRFGRASVAYDHGVMGGGGYLYGGRMDDVTGSFSRQFGRQVGSQTTLEFAGGYRRSDALNSIEGSYDAKYGSAQFTRSLGRYVSVYASYTGTVQSPSSQVSGNVLNGLWQVIGFGIGFTPPQIRLRH